MAAIFKHVKSVLTSTKCTFQFQLNDGLVGRECPNAECSPGYFKVKLGTGITEGQVHAYCPYCRQEGEPSDFTTQAQIDYALGVLKNEVVKGIDKSIQKALQLGSSHKKTYGSGMFKMEMTYKSSKPDYVPRPLEEELRRDIICPNCGLEHAVFGLATWCPDCERMYLCVMSKLNLALSRKLLV